MRQRFRSIEWRLSCAFVLVAMTLMGGSLFALEQLGDFDRQSAEIRDQLLQKTRFVGDLNNFTSDFRAAEASRILSSNASAAAHFSGQIGQLDAEIHQAQANYARLSHDSEELSLYAGFSRSWLDYRRFAAEVLAYIDTGHQEKALALFSTSSQSAYDAANALLDKLTALTNERGRNAGEIAHSALKQAQWFSRIAVLLGSSMVIGGLIYVRFAVTKPLLGLADSMRRLSMTEMDVSIPGTDRHDEIGEMARAALVFRTNAVELLFSQSGLANQASMLAEKLAHEKELTQLQRNFVSMASHEFRTPLTIIDGQAQRLINLSDRISKSDIVDRAKRIRFAVDRTNHVISRMLNAASILDGELNLYFHPEPMNLVPVLREVCSTYREIAVGANIVEAFDMASVQIMGDEKLLFQAFSNILANALKYSPTGAPIEINVTERAGRCMISVEDHGIGIPISDTERIFERFHRGSNTAGTAGTGIGLFLVKTVVELHHGEVVARNRAPSGAIFELALPLLAKAADPPTQNHKVKMRI